MDSTLNELTTEASTLANDVIAFITLYGLSVIGAFIILVIGLWVAGWASRVTLRAMRRAKYVDPTLCTFFASLVKYLIIVLTGITVLGKFGVQTASLLTVMGAAGLAIGLALQGTLSHVAAGIMLLIFRPFREGDQIETGAAKGKVIEVTLFVTHIVDPDGVFTIVPNSLLWGTAIRNLSHKPDQAA